LTEYVKRTYRLLHNPKDLAFFQIAIKETDLDIGVSLDILTPQLIQSVNDEVRAIRKKLEDYIMENELFARTLESLVTPKDAPEIIRRMAEAGRAAGIGPMSAVAGAISQCVGQFLSRRSSEVIVENGGEGSVMAAPIFRRVVALYFSNYEDPGGLMPWEEAPYVPYQPTPTPSADPTSGE